MVSVVRPFSLLFLGLLALTFGSALAGLVCGLWRVVRGPKRHRALAWLLAALLPILSWGALAVYAHRNGQRRHVPHNTLMTLMTRAGHNLMEAQAVYLYPHRLESQRLVMFYDDQVTDPEGDLGAMDRHVARMEEMTGLSLQAKIYWVRGPLLGRRGLCCNGVALGSEQSPADHLDRHELAHAVLYQHYSPDTEPPTLLSEGWAESQSVDSKTLAESALELRRLLAHLATAPESEVGGMLDRFVDREGFGRLLRKGRGPEGGIGSFLRELTDDFWYHHGNGPVYSVGGAFVSFLLGKHGAARFVEFYFACRPGTFEAECRRVFGTDLDALEKEFWEDAERLARDQLPRK